MKRVKKSSRILHVINTDSKAHSWEKLIFAAQSELQRIEQRADQLKQAILVFRKKEKAGDPPILDTKDLATHN
jgi:hypothetical protein